MFPEYTNQVLIYKHTLTWEVLYLIVTICTESLTYAKSHILTFNSNAQISQTQIKGGKQVHFKQFIQEATELTPFPRSLYHHDAF